MGRLGVFFFFFLRQECFSLTNKKNVYFFFHMARDTLLFTKSKTLFFSKFQTIIRSNKQAFESTLAKVKLGLILLKRKVNINHVYF